MSYGDRRFSLQINVVGTRSQAACCRLQLRRLESLPLVIFIKRAGPRLPSPIVQHWVQWAEYLARENTYPKDRCGHPMHASFGLYCSFLAEIHANFQSVTFLGAIIAHVMHWWRKTRYFPSPDCCLEWMTSFLCLRSWLGLCSNSLNAITKQTKLELIDFEH